MAKIHAYLNFNGNCKEAFDFYQQVFKTESVGTYRYGDMPADPNMPALPDDAKDLIMHTAIKINDSTMIMGSDTYEAFSPKATFGTSTYIMLDAENAEEAKELHTALAKDAQNIEMDLAETFFAELYSSFQDKFGISWMVHFEGNKKMG